MYKAMQVSAPGKLELVERKLQDPPAGHVRIRVEACGVCHTDALTVEGLFPGLVLPRVPGHEVVGRIDGLGSNVSGWHIGQRVGVGFLAGQCASCVPCYRGDLVNCQKQGMVGITSDGGYAESMLIQANALVSIPDSLSSVEAAPLLCAGVTTFNALRNSAARAGDVVAIQGVGGLGHLAIQFARRMGFHTVALTRGADKCELAKKLGAHTVIDSLKQDPVATLRALGGAKVIVATASDTKSMGPLVDGLAPRGQLVVAGAANDPISVSATSLLFGMRSVHGTNTGSMIDGEDTLKFSVLQDVHPIVQTLPLEKAQEGYALMMRNEARFRVVLTIAK
jgi:D-arabinose 1-dehydrogenase-like Zn-dependent alcohol dehydrogenase